MKRNILIVDDDETTVIILEKILKDKGFEILTAYNGQEALNLLETSEKTIDGIILDILMPVMDGRETLKHLRENKTTKELPVMVLTGELALSSVSELKALGANDYMIKPYDEGTLLARLTQILPMDLDFEEEKVS